MPATIPDSLLPVPLPTAMRGERVAQLARQLAARGFQLSDTQLLGAPSFLRGADWPSLLAKLCSELQSEPQPESNRENADVIVRVCSQHLLMQPVSQQAEFWQPVIAWAARNASECGRELSATDWSAL